jgi:hypothetical protein
MVFLVFLQLPPRRRHCRSVFFDATPATPAPEVRRTCGGVIGKFLLAYPVCPPHMTTQSPGVITWAHEADGRDGVGTSRTSTQSGRYGPEELSRPARATDHRAPVGGLPPSPEQRDKVARPLGKGVKSAYRAGWHSARSCSRQAPEALSSWGAGGLRGVRDSTISSCIAGCYSSTISGITASINEQGVPLFGRSHFAEVIAACELPVARGKLKNRIKTSLASPLCRGVDELCTLHKPG